MTISLAILLAAVYVFGVITIPLVATVDHWWSCHLQRLHTERIARQRREMREALARGRKGRP